MSDFKRLQLRIVRSHGGSKNIVMPVPEEGCGLADALELGGERLNDTQWRSANQCRIERVGAGWQLRNDSRTLVCVVNNVRVPADEPVALRAGDTLELGLLRFEIETTSGFATSPVASPVAGGESPTPVPMSGLLHPGTRFADASVADAVEFDLRDLAAQPSWSGATESSQTDSLDDPFGVLGIAGAEARPAGDSLAELLGEAPSQVATPNGKFSRLSADALHRAEPEPQGRTSAVTQVLKTSQARKEFATTRASRPDTAALLLDGLHEEFVRVVRDPDQLAGQADWEGMLTSDGDSAPTLDELSHRAAPYPLLRDILLEREGIDQIIDNFDPLTPSALLDATEIDDVLHLFAPELARGAKAALPSLTRREHHEVSPDSHMQPGRLPTDIP